MSHNGWTHGWYGKKNFGKVSEHAFGARGYRVILNFDQKKQRPRDEAPIPFYSCRIP